MHVMDITGSKDIYPVQTGPISTEVSFLYQPDKKGAIIIEQGYTLCQKCSQLAKLRD